MDNDDQYHLVVKLYVQEYKVKEIAYRALCQKSLPIIIKTVCGQSDIDDVEKLDNDSIRRLYHRFPVLGTLGTNFNTMKYKDVRTVARGICKNLGVLEYSELIVALL